MRGNLDPVRWGALALVLGAAIGCSHERVHIAVRPPLQSDMDLCALRALELGDRTPMGRVRLHLLVRDDGSVYAAYVHNTAGIDDRSLQRCLAHRATTWVLAPAPVEYERAYELSFVPGGSELGDWLQYWNGEGATGQGRGIVILPDTTRSSPPLPIEQPVARDTLTIADSATAAEQGTALVSVGRAAEALPLLRSAVQNRPDDPAALLGLTRALTDTRGDLAEARKTALRLLEIAPDSVVGHEALLRVCLAANDSACSIREWKAAVHAPDAGARSRILFELQAPTQQAALRLHARRMEPAGR
jgi:tetratricopeptide (TPR) repeat protein